MNTACTLCLWIYHKLSSQFVDCILSPSTLYMHGCIMLMDLSLAVLTACLLHAILHHWSCTSTLTLLRLLAFKGSPLVPSPGRQTCTSYSPDMLTCTFGSFRLPNRSGDGLVLDNLHQLQLRTNVCVTTCIQNTNWHDHKTKTCTQIQRNLSIKDTPN